MSSPHGAVGGLIDLGSLGIQIDHYSVVSVSGRSDGEVQGKGSFSGFSLLAVENDGFHERIVHTFTCAQAQECTSSRMLSMRTEKTYHLA